MTLLSHLLFLTIYILFSVYTRPLGELQRIHGVRGFLARNSTYLSVMSDSDSAVQCLSYCLVKMRAWMRACWLKCNPDKTEKDEGRLGKAAKGFSREYQPHGLDAASAISY